jgi:LacI family transcriptional regulator
MRLSPDVETRVIEAARETGYRPNFVSRALRTGSTHTIGFVSDTVATQRFAGDLIRGAVEAARERGYLLFVGETEGDPELQRELIEAMLDRQVHGVALTSMYTRKVAVPKPLLERPAVLLNAYPLRPAPIASVVPDELEAGRTAARVLIDAGYREGVHLIGAGPHRTRGPKGAMAAVLRLQGIREVADQAGMRIEGAVPCRDWEPENGFEATKQLLASKRPQALICFNDRLSVGALHALAEHGLEVPRDVSIVSFDDDPIASWIRPQLTTIALPHYELGRAAIDLLLDGERARQPDVHLVPMPLRERASVRYV